MAQGRLEVYLKRKYGGKVRAGIFWFSTENSGRFL
jgi:hypothetical protein